jgi:hypothetical protein
MKLSLTKNAGTDQLVKMEVNLLCRLSKLSPGFPKFYHSGVIDGFRYIVMDLLGNSLAEVQLNMPEERFSIKTTIRIGLQLIDVSFYVKFCVLIRCLGHRDDPFVILRAQGY